MELKRYALRVAGYELKIERAIYKTIRVYEKRNDMPNPILHYSNTLLLQ